MTSPDREAYIQVETPREAVAMATKRLNTTVDTAIHDRLDRLATRTGWSRSHYAAEFIERGLNDLEDHYLLKDALEEFQASGDEPVAHHDVDWDSLGR